MWLVQPPSVYICYGIAVHIQGLPAGMYCNAQLGCDSCRNIHPFGGVLAYHEKAGAAAAGLSPGGLTSLSLGTAAGGNCQV